MNWWGTTTLEPGKTFKLNGGNNYEVDLDGFVWKFTYKDSSGRIHETSTFFTLSHDTGEIKKPILANEDFDTINLRYNADFEIPVFNKIDWVPANILGQSDLTNKQVLEMINQTPEQKRAVIDNVYEALQFYQVGGFSDLAETNTRRIENGIDWEYHIPGYDAVRINGGNCSTSSSWFTYMLEGKYDEVGYIAYSQETSNGHVYNYIKQDGIYYFIDLTHYRLDFIESSSVESGKLEDYMRSDRVNGNIHRTESIEAYVDYIHSTYNDPPEMLFMYKGGYVADIGVRREVGKTIMCYPNDKGVTIIYDDQNDNISAEFINGPIYQPDWSTFPSNGFNDRIAW